VCDCCNDDITVTGKMPKFRFRLTAEELPSDIGGLMYAVHVPPPIDRDYHFCSMECLNSWVRDRVTLGKKGESDGMGSQLD